MIGARGKTGWLPEELQRDAKRVYRGYKAFAPSVDLNKGEQPVKIEMEKEAKAKDKDQEPRLRTRRVPPTVRRRR